MEKMVVDFGHYVGSVVDLLIILALYVINVVVILGLFDKIKFFKKNMQKYFSLVFFLLILSAFSTFIECIAFIKLLTTV